MNEKREVDINKTIICQLIISQITFLIVNLSKNTKDEELIVNKSILINGIYGDFLYNFIKNIKFTKYFLLNFINVYIKYVRSKKGRSFKHTCKRANYRWYFKKYFKNNKSVHVQRCTDCFYGEFYQNFKKLKLLKSITYIILGYIFTTKKLVCNFDQKQQIFEN